MGNPEFKRSLLSSAIALACYSGASSAACPGTVTGVEGPCALPGNGSVTIDASGRLPSIAIAAPGTGRITNHGAIRSTSLTSAVVNYAGNLAGTLTNSGTIKNVQNTTSAYAIYIENSLTGTLNNSGTITASNNNGSSAFGVYIYEGNLSGSLNNTGVIAGVGDGTTWNYGYGVYLDGNTTGNLSGTLDNQGTITGQATGGTWGSAYGVYVDGYLSTVGVLNNSGTINAIADGTTGISAFGVYISDDLNGTLDNSGLINASAVNSNMTSGAAAYGVYLDSDLNGTFDNSGTIKAYVEGSTWGSAYGVYVSGDVNGTLDNSGTIHAEINGANSAGAYGLYVDGDLAAAGALTNSGLVRAEGMTNSGADSVYGLYINGTVHGAIENTDTGAIEAVADGTTWSNAFGAYLDDDISTSGSLTNAGTIFGDVVAGSGGTAYGIYIDDNLDGTLDNSGSIRGSVNATTTGGSAYGVYVGTDLNGTLTNSGHIAASVTATNDHPTEQDASAWFAGVHVDGDLAGTLDNSGTISGTGTINGKAGFNSSSVYGYGIYIDDDVSPTGTLTNSGLIEAISTNSGAQGTTGTNSLLAYGIYVSGDFNGTLINRGTITAAINGAAANTAEFGIYIDGDSSAGVFTNSGTINGNVQLNGGTLNLNGGRIFGAITSVNMLDVNIGGLVVSSQTNLSGANVDDFVIKNRGDWVFDRNMVDVATFSVLKGGRLTFAKTGPSLVENVPSAGTVAVNAGVVGALVGNYTHLAGATFETGSSKPTNFGQLNVSGTADLSASNKVFVNLSGLAANGRVEDILTAGTLVAGPFTTTDNSLFYDFNAVKDGNTVDLVVERGRTAVEIVNGASLPYAVGAAGALDGLLDAGGTGGEMDAALIALGNLGSEDEVAQAIAQMVPSLAGEAAQASMQIANLFSGVVGNRISGQRGLSAGDGDLYDEFQSWVKPFGGWAEADSRDGVPGFEAQTHGVAFGGDAKSGKLRLGAGFAWAKSELEGKTVNTNEFDIDSYQLVVYGDYDINDTDFAQGYAIVGFNDNESRRDISFGTVNSTARADYDSIFTRIFAGVGRHYRTSDQFTFAPVLTMRYTYIDQDGYTETGAGPLDLDVDSTDNDSLILGLDGVGTYTFGADSIYAMTMRAGVGYDVLTDQTLVTSTFTGGGTAFTTQDSEPDEFVYRAGIGLKATPLEMMSVRIDYEFEGRSDYQSHGAAMNFRWQW